MNELSINPRDNNRQRVVVAMSGGVDSSVAAALLLEQGYEVIGMMMRLWSEPGSGPAAPANRCCTPDQMADARRVADQLGIPFYVADVQQHFRQTIVQFFLDEHDAGRTPNPCVECNRQIRFGYLLDRALALDADFLATGHYARVVQEDGAYLLKQGKDSHKDQSYVLHTFRQSQLAHVLFPVGEYTKDEVRHLARDHGLPVASKQESQDLCFLNDGNYRRFIHDHSTQDHPTGPILDLNERELGRHEGLPFYTIGQRKGLGIAAAEPLFVLGKDTARNALIVGPREALGAGELVARDVNWISGRPPAGPIRAEVKIRYKATPIQSVVTPLDGNQAHVAFSTLVPGVTPGQAAVFYEGDTCLGGGLIRDTVQPINARRKTPTAGSVTNK
ncbi:MAG: tRNA 2-thiouridine(34) synthase MnmA [Chloroflexota bacterium]